MCNCCKNALARDIDKLNIMVREDRDFKESKGDKAYRYGRDIDIISHFAGLIPKAVFKEIDFDVLKTFRRKGHIDKNILFENIKFENRICRLCKVEDGESKSLTLDEFNELKLL